MFLQRMARIKSNAAKLLQLDVQQNVVSLHVTNTATAVHRNNTGKRKPVRQDAQRRQQPSRASARLQGSAQHFIADSENSAALANNADSSLSGETRQQFSASI